jgi:lactobin A/cerein 7B family class IIb bacteriocin
MAAISISDIHSAGHDLFSDNESFMADLSENELARVVGGTDPIFTPAMCLALGCAAGAAFLGGLWAGLR